MVEHGRAAPGQQRVLCCLCTPFAAQLRGVAAGPQQCKMKASTAPQCVTRLTSDLNSDTALVSACVRMKERRRELGRPRRSMFLHRDEFVKPTRL